MQCIYCVITILQLNGVELPCGSILSVQPADMDYKKKKKYTSEKNLRKNNDNVKKMDVREDRCNETKQLQEKNKSMVDVKVDDPKAGDHAIEDNGEDDLDDFFASL